MPAGARVDPPELLEQVVALGDVYGNLRFAWLRNGARETPEQMADALEGLRMA